MTDVHVVTMVMGTIIAVITMARDDPGPAFTLNLEPLQQVAAHWLQWNEIEPLRTNLGGLAAIALSRDDRFAIVAGHTLLCGRLQEDSSRDLHIALPEVGRAAAFAPDGTLFVALERSWLEFAPNSSEPVQGSSLSSSSFLTSIAVTTGHVWLADFGERLVWVFERRGALRAQIRGTESYGFLLPSPHFDLAPAGPDRAWIVNPGELRVELWTPEGQRIRQWGRPGMEVERFCGCCNPTDLAVMPDGFVATAEKGIVRVKIHRPDGSLESVVAAPAQFAAGTAGLDLASDSTGRLYVADRMRQAVRVFERRTNVQRP